MTRRISRELIKHLEWTPGQEEPQIPDTNPTPQPVQQGAVSIDALVSDGREFYSEEKDSSNNYIGVAVALKEAVDQIGSEGIIANIPYLIAGKAQADKDNYLWKNWFTALSEENVGIDKEGKFVRAGQPIVLTVHGGGILTSDRIQQAYDEGLTDQSAAKFSDEEFDNLLKGVLPSEERIQIYSLDDVKRGNIPNPFGRYAVWTDFETAKSKSSGHHTKNDFMNNELVIARAGTLEHLDTYFEKAKSSDSKVGNWHRFGEIDYNQSQGRVLFLCDNCSGLDGDNSVNGSGRFVGVAAEPRRAKK